MVCMCRYSWTIEFNAEYSHLISHQNTTLASHTAHPLRRRQYVNDTMVPFRSGLLTCLLASTSSAFAFKPVTHSTSLSQQHGTAINRLPVNLRMSGGQIAVPDLKPPAAIYEGAVAAGAGACKACFFRADALNFSHYVLFDISAKASASWAKIFKLGIAAGCHIGFGSYLAITVGGACPQLAEANPGLQKVREYLCILFPILFNEVCIKTYAATQLFMISMATTKIDYLWCFRASFRLNYDLGHGRGALHGKHCSCYRFSNGRKDDPCWTNQKLGGLLRRQLRWIAHSCLPCVQIWYAWDCPRQCRHCNCQVCSFFWNCVRSRYPLQLARLHGSLHGLGMCKSCWKDGSRVVPHQCLRCTWFWSLSGKHVHYSLGHDAWREC